MDAPGKVAKNSKACPRQLHVANLGELCESYVENDIRKSEYRVVCEVVLESRCEVTMSSTQRLGKEVASSSRKRVRTGTTIPLAPAVPRGQTQRYGAKAVTSEGKKWY
ncbi:hypothetical protein H5410_056920 [Solanum commersonii]|uniref:Uncharacterized protein n=1 Tax=Solanum commersonii TaxID=4109 RepID=A0A9J5WMM7_SOLCO|nr:hypothetical protein H5410_056920 [Solanum commersonii]